MIGYHGVSLLSDAFAKGIPMDGKRRLKLWYKVLT